MLCYTCYELLRLPCHLPLTSPSSLDSIITESLRLHPVVPVLAKRAMRDVTVDGTWISKGTFVFIDVAGYQTSLEPDFHPVNKSTLQQDPAYKSKQQEDRFIAFGGGGMRCVGEDTARHIARNVVWKVMQGWQLELVEGQEFVEAFRLTVGFKKGLFVKKKRKQRIGL